jgi:HEAT repeat protein
MKDITMRRCIRHIRHIAITLLLAGQAPARATDPVEDLRLALRTTFPATGSEAEQKYQLDYRRKLLEKRIQALGIGDLRRALLLQEWRDLDRRDPDRAFNVADLDRALRDQVVDRLVDSLRELLHSDNPTVRLAAIAQIRELGVSVRGRDQGFLGQKLAPDLVKLFDDPDPLIRSAASQAFGFIVPEPKLVPELAKVLRDREASVRVAGAQALAELVRTIQPLMKSRGVSSIDEINKAQAAELGAVATATAQQGLNLEPLAARDASLEAIRLAAILLRDLILESTPQDFPPPDRRLTQEERLDIARYRQIVEDERADVMPLARALGQAIPDVANRLSAARDRNRDLAIRTLAEISLARLRMLRKAQSVPRPPAEKRGDVALPRGAILRVSAQAPADPLDDDPLRPGLVGAIPAVSRSLADPDVSVRRIAVNILETLSHAPEIPQAVPAITRALADPDVFVRWSAARLLGRIGPVNADATVPALARLLTDGDLDVQMATATALARLGPSAAAAVPTLARQVSRGDPENRVEMIQALQAIGVVTPEVVQALAAALGNDDPRVREASASALRTFGPAARAAIPELEKILNDPNETVRAAVSDALLAVSVGK